MKAIPGVIEHVLEIAVKEKKKIWKIVRKTCIEIRISLLKDLKIRKRAEEVINLVDIVVPHLWVNFKDRILEACDEVCKKMRVEEVKEICGGEMKR